jgi:Ca-activated chloride channel homolog
VYVLLDVSRSMDATDLPPSRLEQAKFAIRQLADTLGSDRFGLILFASQPFVLAPLTNDHVAFGQLLYEVHTSMAATGGTDLCAAIALATRKFMADPSTAQSAKVLVLVSDGEDFGQCNPLILSQLRTIGITLITVGVGTESGSPIRAGRDFVRDEQGLVARSRLNREFLRRLATDGQGSYHEADPDNRYLDGLTLALRQVQGRTINQRRIAVSTNKYYYFLLAALVLVAVDMVAVVRALRL